MRAHLGGGHGGSPRAGGGSRKAYRSVFRKRAGVRYRRSRRELRASVLTPEFESGLKVDLAGRCVNRLPLLSGPSESSGYLEEPRAFRARMGRGLTPFSRAVHRAVS